MSIVTDTAAFLQGPDYWPSRLTDSCVVKRETSTVFSDITGQYTPTYTTNYSGPCLVRPDAPSEVGYGQEQVGTRGYTVFIPSTEVAQLRGDLVDVTSATDTFLTGKTFTVTNVPGDTYVTVRRLVCEEVE